MPESSSSTDEELSLEQVKELALLIPRLFYKELMPQDLEGSPFLKGTSFENKVITETEADRYQLIAEFSRKLIQINPHCSTASRYLAACLKEGIAFIPQDLVGTRFEGHFGSIALMSPRIVAFELYRKAIAINPRDTRAIYGLCISLVEGTNVVIVAEDLVGTILEGSPHPEALSQIAVMSVLARKVMDLYKNIESRDLAYRLARRILMRCLLEWRSDMTEKNLLDKLLKEEDLKGTPFEGYSLSSLNSAENYAKVTAWFVDPRHARHAFTSLSNARAMLKTIEQSRDLERMSIVSANQGIFYQLIRNQFLCENPSKLYLETDYIKQDYRFRVGQDLTESAYDLTHDETVITKSMLSGSKWEETPENPTPEAPNRSELQAEFARKALKVNPTNAHAMYRLITCIVDRVEIKKVDLVLAGCKKPYSNSGDYDEIIRGLCQRALLMEPYNKELRSLLEAILSVVTCKSKQNPSRR